MSGWKEYTGSDEQIAEMLHSIDNGGGYLCRRKGLPDRHETLLCPMSDGTIVTHYLICNPHPLSDMICQQARTGQPVWIQQLYNGKWLDYAIGTSLPNWTLVMARYSFMPFKD